jgi:hypothetical protein
LGFRNDITFQGESLSTSYGVASVLVVL